LPNRTEARHRGACAPLAGLLLLALLLPSPHRPAWAGSAALPRDPMAVATLREGYHRYQGVCGHCHGPDGLGSSFASSLIASAAEPRALRRGGAGRR
jgi:mono/diheme cytochrome c family protein